MGPPGRFLTMSGLSLDFGTLLASDDRPRVRRTRAILANAAAERYQAKHESGGALYAFEQAGAMYWFDLASSKGLPQEDRTIVGWAITPTDVHRRDASYQRGFPMAADLGLPVDRGHLDPAPVRKQVRTEHLSAGQSTQPRVV